MLQLNTFWNFIDNIKYASKYNITLFLIPTLDIYIINGKFHNIDAGFVYVERKKEKNDLDINEVLATGGDRQNFKLI